MYDCELAIGHNTYLFAILKKMQHKKHFYEIQNCSALGVPDIFSIIISRSNYSHNRKCPMIASFCVYNFKGDKERNRLTASQRSDWYSNVITHSPHAVCQVVYAFLKF